MSAQLTGFFKHETRKKGHAHLLDIELMLGNLIATAAAFLITAGRGRPLGSHLYVQVAAVRADASVGPQHWRRRRRVGRGRATVVDGVNHRRNQRLADVEPRRGQIVDGTVFAQHVDLLRRTFGHGIGHAEIVRFVRTSGPRVVQVIVLSVFWGGRNGNTVLRNDRKASLDATYQDLHLVVYYV